MQSPMQHQHPFVANASAITKQKISKRNENTQYRSIKR